MCDPMSMIGAALGVAKSVAGFAAQSAQARAMEKRNRAMAESIKRSTINNYATTQVREEQERRRAGQEIRENNRKRDLAAGRARAVASESGAAGLSVAELLRDVYGEGDRFEGTIRTNFEQLKDQNLLTMKGIQERGQAEINRLPVPRRPSIFGAILGGLGAIGNSYVGYQRSLPVSERTTLFS